MRSRGRLHLSLAPRTTPVASLMDEAGSEMGTEQIAQDGPVSQRLFNRYFESLWVLTEYQLPGMRGRPIWPKSDFPLHFQLILPSLPAPEKSAALNWAEISWRDSLLPLAPSKGHTGQESWQ